MTLAVHETHAVEASACFVHILVGFDCANWRLWVKIDRLHVHMLDARLLKDWRPLAIHKCALDGGDSRSVHIL